MKKTTRLRVMSAFTLLVFLNQLLFPTVALALTGGPGQPETHGFEAVNSNNMVDLFSGDFSYSVPLMDVGGYPINLGYQAGVGMDQEASMVGLGWGLSPGAINRTVRGMPDDFNGDIIRQERNVKPNETVGGDFSVPWELLGWTITDVKALQKLGISVGVGAYYNSYNGWGSKMSVGGSFDLGELNNSSSASLSSSSSVKGGTSATSSQSNSSSNLIASLSIGFDSKSGISANPNLSVSMAKDEVATKFGSAMDHYSYRNSRNLAFGLGLGFQSAAGITSVSYSGSSSFNKMSGTAITGSMNAGHRVSIGYSSEMPVQQYNMRNFNATLDVSVAKELVGNDFQFQGDAYYSTQFLPEDEKQTEAAGYGAMYYQQIGQNGDARGHDQLLDFNRSSDFPYHSGSDYLHMSQTTFDIFSVSGQGIGGAFKLNTHDVPIYGDPVKENRSTDFPISGLGLDFGPSIKVGTNVSVSEWYDQTGAWTSSSLDNLLSLKNRSYFENTDPHFEKQYFKMAGEMTALDSNILQKLNAYEPTRLQINKAGRLWLLNDNLVTETGQKKSLDIDDLSNNRSYNRQARNTNIYQYTNEDAARFGINRNIYSFGAISDSSYNDSTNYTPYLRHSFDDIAAKKTRKPHHIGGFDVTGGNGTRYVYDLPAYNNESYEVGFSKNGTGYDEKYDYYKDYQDSSGLINYQSKDASLENDQGRSNYYTKQEIPAHAHSYLLTGILSPDYVDVTGDGISQDDLGTSVKFNYTQYSDKYGWRAPYGENKARFNHGLQSLNYDDKASYSYGTKELWYVHSIESKTHVAEFYYSDRKDALGVSNEEGAKGTTSEQKMQKLDRIELYNKTDRFTNKEDAVPIKVVYLEYDYSLCKGLPNHELTSGENGKLTLKKIRFSYGKSMKAALSPYVFSYSSYNPDYDLQAYDRWGNFKPNNQEATNDLYPYAEQDASLADQYANAWNLNQIKLPSGGVMNITYEADDYAYVMEKRAHTMHKVRGAGSGVNFREAEYQLYNSTKEHYNLYFDLHPSLYAKGDAAIAKAYLPADSILYYKAGMYIKNESEAEQFVGFAKVKAMGMVKNNPQMGWIELQPKKLDLGTEMHPMSFNAWEFILTNLNEKIFQRSQVPGDDEGFKGELKELAKNVGSLTGFIVGKYRQLRMLRFAKNLVPDETYIRLKEPTWNKKGGGCRVQKIEMSDNWDQVTDIGEAGSYGVVYQYETKNEAGVTISSGVASYEPGFGNEENPYVAPIYYDNYKIPKAEAVKNKWAKKWLSKYISQEEHIIGPIGETFYPNARVGYSEVKVQSLATANATGTPTGYTVNRFYTAKDFPLQIRNTSVDHNLRRTDPVSEQLSGFSESHTAASQGYTVIANDMHGKPESVFSYSSGHKLISGSKYYYKHKPLDANTTSNLLDSRAQLEKFESGISYYTGLDNKVKVLSKTGKISEKEIGIDFDISIDTRANDAESISAKMPSNIDVLQIGAVPIPIPTLYFNNSHSIESFKTATVTKIVQQHGILEEVVAFDENSLIHTKNVLWDETTGQVLMTSTHNEYNDNITNFNYPGHFAYDNLGAASENQGIAFEDVSISTGRLTLDVSLGDADQYFANGDELALVFTEVIITDPIAVTSEEVERAKRAWVKGIKGNKVYVIDRDGKPVHGAFDVVKIIRSGKRNIIGASVSSFTTLEPMPLTGTFKAPGTVTQTAAATFSDDWQTYADQVRVTKCRANETGRMLETILDSMVGVGNWLDSAYDGTLSSSTQRFNLNTLPGYDTSSMNLGFANDNYFLAYDTLSCTITSVIDSVFVYKIFYEGGYEQTTKPMVLSQRYGSFPANWLRTPDIPHDASRVTWKLLSATTRSRDVYSNCNTDTILYSRIAIDPNFTNAGQVQFRLLLGEDKNNDGAYCTFGLSSPLTPGGIDWGAIDSFSHISINQLFSDGNHFQVQAYIMGVNIPLNGYAGTCFSIGDCWKECERVDKDTINPYVHGARGIWRGKDNYAYHASRELAGAITEYNSHTQTRLDGSFTYDPFWTFGSTGLSSNASTNWISPATLSKVSPEGNHVESIDALGRPSAEVYGYDRKLVTAVGQNAYLHDLAFDGFEDYDYPYYFGCRKNHHWALQEDSIDLASHTKVLFSNPSIAVIDLDNVYAIRTETSHTGRASLFVGKNKYVAASDVLFDNDTTTYNRKQLEPYTVGPGNTLQKFAPEKGRKYIVSGWVKQHYHATANVSKHAEAYLRIKINGTSFDESYYASGPLVEGWQRVFAEFTIPDEVGASSIEVFAQVGNFSGTGAYFDDIRIQPFNSAMVTYVYDPGTLRLSAELDENNFATFYEYDQEGRLLRIKKETEQGIVTLQESRYGIPKSE